MKHLAALAVALDKITEVIGKLAAWLIIALMVVILFDVVLRRWFIIGSSGLQELEWHLHGGLFLLCLGFAYLKGSHVRIELFREYWSDKTKIIVEILGIIFLLLPLCVVLIKFGFDYAAMSFAYSEKSAAATGLGALWFIKGVLVFGIFMLMLPATSNLIKCSLWLMAEKNGGVTSGLDAVLSDDTDTA